MAENNIPQVEQPSRDTAAMSYVWVMSVIVLIFRREDEFIQFHARQASFLFLVSIAIWFIPGIGQFLEILVAAAMIFGFIQASQGIRYRFPLIADLVDGKLNLSKVTESIKSKRTEDQNIEDLKVDQTGEELEKEKEQKEAKRRELAEEVVGAMRPEEMGDD